MYKRNLGNFHQSYDHFRFPLLFGPKTLIFTGRKQNWKRKNHLGTLFALFFGQAWDQTGQNGRYLAKNASFGPNLAVFGSKINFLGGGWSKTFGTLITGELVRHLFRVENIDRCDSNWPLGTKMCIFCPQSLDIWGQKSILCFGISIFVNKGYHQYTQGYNFPILTIPKKNSISELWVIFRGSPRFLAISGHSHFASISTLDF